MPDDPVEAALTGARNVPPPAGEGLTCEFCNSRLTQAGQVLSMSDRARSLRVLDERYAQEQTAHAATAAQLATARTRIAELEAAVAPPAPSGSQWGVE